MDGSIALVPATLMPKLEASDISTTSNCDTLPSSFGLALHSAGSPLTSSSISSSSMSELFASPGLTSNEPDLSSNLSENDTGDATSMASTSNLENTRTTSNVPSPIIEEDPKTTFFNELDHVLDGITVDLNMDVKPCSDARHVLDTCCRPDSSSDDMFMSHLDKLLQSSEPHEFVAESSLSCFDDLFSSFSDTQQDFLLPDGAFLHKLEPLPCSEQVEQAAEQGHGGDEENATQMFTHWLRSNAHWISMSDLRKIKLKTSTIENATKRLGGGKKGMTLFLKFVLVWLQNSQSKAALGRRAAAVSSPVVQSGINMGLGCVTTSSVNLQGHPSFLQSDACLMQGSGAPLHGHNGTYSSSVPCGPDWTSSQSRWTSSLVPLEHSLNVPISNTGTPSPLMNTTFEGPWLSQSSMIHGLSSPTLTPAMCSPVGGTSGRPKVSGCYNIASMTMMTQQKQGFDPTPAATTRAARKSRMERQRWSVRRTRKWSGHTIHRTNQPLLVSGVNHGGPPTKLEPWSQVGGSATQSLSNFSGSARANSYQQRFPSRLLPDPQEARKNERCLRLLFDKELKQSDVGNLGRIVLPKKAAETFLPPLESRDGVNLVVEDMNSFKVWNMRYRFWPNNKSRMYLLENTGDFVKSYDLKEGDYMMVYCTNSRNRYVIKGEKGPAQVGASSADNLGHGGGIKKRCTSKKEADVIMLDGANSDESCDDFLLVELIEQSLEASESDMLDAARTHF